MTANVLDNDDLGDPPAEVLLVANDCDSLGLSFSSGLVTGTPTSTGDCMITYYLQSSVWASEAFAIVYITDTPS